MFLGFGLLWTCGGIGSGRGSTGISLSLFLRLCVGFGRLCILGFFPLLGIGGGGWGGRMSGRRVWGSGWRFAIGLGRPDRLPSCSGTGRGTGTPYTGTCTG